MRSILRTAALAATIALGFASFVAGPAAADPIDHARISVTQTHQVGADPLAVTGAPVEMQQRTASVNGPLRGLMNHPEFPACKVVSVGGGRFMRWNGQPVGVGGNCPSNFRIGSWSGSSNSMVISGMQCSWSSSSPGSGYCR